MVAEFFSCVCVGWLLLGSETIYLLCFELRALVVYRLGNEVTSKNVKSFETLGNPTKINNNSL